MSWKHVAEEALNIRDAVMPGIAMLKQSCASIEDRVWIHAGSLDRYYPKENRPLPEGFGQEPWVHVKLAAGLIRPVFQKQAGEPLKSLFSALQLTPNRFNGMFGGPTPLAASLAGGLIGSGLGYGAGYIGEKVLGPNVVEPGRLRRRAALLGGGLGAIPGLYLGSVGARLNAQDGKSQVGAFFEPNRVFGEKTASAGGLFDSTIQVDAFNRAVWRDQYTPESIQALTTGIVSSASRAADKPWFISPYDVGRIAVGMGGGLVSGMLAGKVLGTLAGLTPQAQNAIQRTGMWAGALQQAVPLIFGGR